MFSDSFQFNYFFQYLPLHIASLRKVTGCYCAAHTERYMCLKLQTLWKMSEFFLLFNFLGVVSSAVEHCSDVVLQCLVLLHWRCSVQLDPLHVSTQLNDGLALRQQSSQWVELSTLDSKSECCFSPRLPRSSAWECFDRSARYQCRRGGCTPWRSSWRRQRRLRRTCLQPG